MKVHTWSLGHHLTIDPKDAIAFYERNEAVLPEFHPFTKEYRALLRSAVDYGADVAVELPLIWDGAIKPPDSCWPEDADLFKRLLADTHGAAEVILIYGGDLVPLRVVDGRVEEVSIALENDV